MVEWKHVSRRKFIKRCLSASAGISLFSIIPFPTLKNYLPPSKNGIPFQGQPYWREVLSRGVSFIPAKARIDIHGWSNDDLRGKAYYALRIAFEQNEDILLRRTQRSEKEMGIIVDNNKFGQFLLEAIKGKYLFCESLTAITFHQDPIRARIFYDLSSMAINHIITKVDKFRFNGFTESDIHLLRSAETYLREGVQTSKNAMEIFPDRFRNLLRSNIGTGYNNLGLTLNLLGEIDRAYQMYRIALEWNPDDNNVISNLEAIHENAVYMHQKPSWGDFFPDSKKNILRR